MNFLKTPQVETTIKESLGALLSDLSDYELSSVRRNTGNASLALAGRDSLTKLGRGLLILADKELGEQRQPAFVQGPRGLNPLAYSYGREYILCVFAQEIFQGNLNVQELRWKARQANNDQPTCRFVEYGLGGIRMMDVICSDYDEKTGEKARYKNISPLCFSDFVIRDEAAGPDTIGRFFEQVQEPAVLESLQTAVTTWP